MRTEKVAVVDARIADITRAPIRDEKRWVEEELVCAEQTLIEAWLNLNDDRLDIGDMWTTEVTVYMRADELILDDLPLALKMSILA